MSLVRVNREEELKEMGDVNLEQLLMKGKRHYDSEVFKVIEFNGLIWDMTIKGSNWIIRVFRRM